MYQVLRRLNLPQEKEKKLDVFVSYTTDPQYHGSFAMKNHSLLGVPLNFAWRTVDDFEQNKDSVFKKNFPWGHPSAESIKQILVLDDEEKEFVIARQIGYLDTKNVWGRLIQRCICITLGFAMGHSLNYKFGHYKERSRIRSPNIKIGTIFGLSAILWYFIASYVNDSYNCYLDTYADSYAATIDQQMAAAGKRYYDKMIRSNIATREIVPGAEHKFTIYGNEQQGLLRTKTIPLIARRDYMQKMALSQSEVSQSEASQ